MLTEYLDNFHKLSRGNGDRIANKFSTEIGNTLENNSNNLNSSNERSEKSWRSDRCCRLRLSENNVAYDIQIKNRWLLSSSLSSTGNTQSKRFLQYLSICKYKGVSVANKQIGNCFLLNDDITHRNLLIKNKKFSKGLCSCNISFQLQAMHKNLRRIVLGWMSERRT